MVVLVLGVAALQTPQVHPGRIATGSTPVPEILRTEQTVGEAGGFLMSYGADSI